ncbi:MULTISPECIES: spore coat associated protein CotJA [unclassified Clostridium]|nr:MULTISPECIES: spore coat associated protein CotJA [unclassified Clostridium]MBP3915938.1 spore coat associated protein CotJA [Clostridium sp.]MEE0932694.1 spore coat associated protein CotJA [Clostridium sp.]
MSKYEKNDYAKAFIILQKYESLLNLTTSLKRGTIFKDLYRPYTKNNKKY